MNFVELNMLSYAHVLYNSYIWETLVYNQLVVITYELIYVDQTAQR